MKKEKVIKKDLGKDKELVIKIENSTNSPIPEVAVKKKKFNFWGVLMVFLTVGSVAGMGYFGYNYMELQKEIKSDKEEVAVVGNEDKEKNSNNDNENDVANMDENVEGEEEVCETGIVEFDEDYNQYINCESSFLLKIPKQAYSYYGDCEFVDDASDNSYRPRKAEVPVGVIDDEDGGVYVSFEYRYELGDERREGGRSYYDSCEKQETTLSYLEEQRRTWHIISQEVNNEDELGDFIQDRFGEGCSVGNQEEADQEGIFRVHIEGDGLPLGESACPTNFAFYIYYAPEINIAYTWDLGHAMSFPVTEDYMEAYDQEMIDSFEVLVD